MPIDATKFETIGTLYFFNAPFVNPSGLSQQLAEDLSASLIRVRVVPTRPNENWYHAGILSQLAPGGQVVARVEVPIAGVVWAASPIVRPYRLSFYRTKGMRAQTVSVLVDRYTGPDSDWAGPTGTAEIRWRPLISGESIEVSPGIWQSTYEFSVGTANREFGLIGVYLRRDDLDEEVSISEAKFGSDSLRIVAFTDHLPVPGELSALIAIGSR